NLSPRRFTNSGRRNPTRAKESSTRTRRFAAKRAKRPRAPRLHKVVTFMAVERSEKRKLRQSRVRRKAVGNDQRPRLSVFRSLNHIYVQVISDQSGHTLAAASTSSTDVRDALESKRNLAAAK